MDNVYLRAIDKACSDGGHNNRLWSQLFLVSLHDSGYMLAPCPSKPHHVMAPYPWPGGSVIWGPSYIVEIET